MNKIVNTCAINAYDHYPRMRSFDDTAIILYGANLHSVESTEFLNREDVKEEGLLEYVRNEWKAFEESNEKDPDAFRKVLFVYGQLLGMCKRGEVTQEDLDKTVMSVFSRERVARLVMEGVSYSKIPWFRFRLSTAILVMLIAGGLLWINLYGSVSIRACYFQGDRSRIVRFDHYLGWPLTIFHFEEKAGGLSNMKGNVCEFISPGDYAEAYDRCFVGSMVGTREEWDYVNIALNCLFAGFFMFLGGFVFEAMSRHMARSMAGARNTKNPEQSDPGRT